jgi:hypothetical protein
MKYVISNVEKRFQRNMLWQLWRFMVLGLRFFKLTKQG